MSKADVSSSNAIVSVTPIYTKTWTTVIDTIVSYDLGGGNTILAEIVGSREVVVDCDLSLCDISCGVTALNNRYLSERISNPTEANKIFASLTRITQLMEMFKIQQECGLNTQAATTLTAIRTEGNFTAGCGCSDSSVPVQIIPLCGSGGTSVSVIQGTGITVTTTVNGNQITYSVALSAAYIALINSLAPTDVVGTAYIGVVKTTPGGVNTYTLTNLAPFIPLNTQEAKCLLTWSNFAAPTMTCVVSDIVKEGSNMTNLVVTPVATIGVGSWK